MTAEEEDKEVEIFENWWQTQRLIPDTHDNKIISLTSWMVRADLCINAN